MKPQLRSLSEFCSIKHGFAFSSSNFGTSGTHIVVSPGNFHEEGGFRANGSEARYYTAQVPGEYVLAQNDLLVVMTEQKAGLLGSTALIPASGRYLHNQRLGLVTGLNETKLDRVFLYHVLNSRPVRQQISVAAGGTKVRHSSPDKILAVTFWWLPLTEQKKIAAILSTWERAITLTEDLISAKQQRKDALMQQLLTGKVRFKQFVKSSEKTPTHYGEIPSDWQYLRIGDVAEEVSERNKGGANHQVLSCTKYDGLVDSLAYFGRQIFSDDLATYKVVRRGQFAYATNHIEEGSIGYQNVSDTAVISPMYTVFKTNGSVDDGFL